jgi:hypothetical protein
MALSWQDLVSLTEDDSQEDITQLQDETTVSDYFADVIRAPVGGLSRAVQGLLQLGALPVDYALNKDFTAKLDNWFDGWVPDAQTGVGKVAQTIVQFGAPLGVASKIAKGASFLKKASDFRKLSDPKLNFTGKTLEISKRAGYFGAIGGATDIAVGVTGRDKALGEVLGLQEEVDLSGMSGSDRALEALKQKIAFGAEGATIGGAIPLLPVAGTLGAKFLGKAYTTSLGPIGIQKGVNFTLRQLDKPVQKMSELIAGKGKEGNFISTAIKKGGSLLDAATEKVGLSGRENWKFFDENAGTMPQVIKKKIDNLLNAFSSSNILNPALKTEGDRVSNQLAALSKRMVNTDNRIDTTLNNLMSKYKTNLYDKLTNAPGYVNIRDRIQIEHNKINDYLRATTKDKAAKTLKQINSAVQKEAKELKQILKETNTAAGNLFKQSKVKSFKELGQMMIQQSDNFFRQHYAAFNNRKFKFDTDGDVGKAVKKELEKITFKNADFRAYAGVNAKALTKQQSDKLYDKVLKNKKLTDTEKAAYDEIANAAENRITMMKRGIINAGSDPNKFFNGIYTAIGKDLPKIQVKRGQLLPDVIKKFLSLEKGAKVPIKEYRNSLLESVIYNAKQTYKKNYFDLVEKEWLKNGIIFKSRQEAISKGIDGTRVQQIKAIATDGLKPQDPAFLSGLFKNNYYTLPEIRNAVLSTKSQFDNFFDNAWYSNIMQIKAGAQIAKTIFSPMTQIRNVTTASFFPLASGLIGTRSSLSDAFKLVADDIFQGAKTDLNKLNAEVDDLVTRGVIDQNIQVGEIKNILDKAQQGKISFNSFMSNPTVKKFVDVYQGGDNVWKIYADRFYQSALIDAFGNPKANPNKVLQEVKDWYRTVAKDEFIEDSVLKPGTKKSADEALKEVSAYLVTNTMPTYSKVPKVIQELRKLPLGNFIAFPAEIIRTSANLVTIGARELTSTNPYIRQMGARRLIGASMTFGGIGKIVQETGEYLTGVSQDTMEKARRSFVPIYERNATLIPVSKPDENGNFKYINFSYSNPYDTLVRPVNAVLNAYGNGQLRKDSVDTIIYNMFIGDAENPGAIPELISPFISESIGTERLADVSYRRGETRSGSKVFYEDDDLQTKMARSFEHILGGLEPGAATSFRRVWQGATGQFTDSGTARDARDELTALLSGVRIQEVKPLASMPFIITSFNKDQRNINNKFARVAYGPNTSAEQKLSAFKNNILDSFYSQKQLYQTYIDAQELGVDEDDLNEMLLDRLKNREQVGALMEGEFKTPNFSSSAFRAQINRLERENPAAAAQFEDSVETVMELFTDMRDEVRGFDLNDSLDSLELTIDQLLSPSVPEIRRMPQRLQVFEQEQTPSLPTNITGTPVASNVLSNPQDLGQRFNLTAQLSPEEKTQFLFGSRIV